MSGLGLLAPLGVIFITDAMVTIAVIMSVIIIVVRIVISTVITSVIIIVASFFGEAMKL